MVLVSQPFRFDFHPVAFVFIYPALGASDNRSMATTTAAIPSDENAQLAAELPSAEEQLRKVFTYQQPNSEQVQAMQEIREQAFALSLLIAKHCPRGADRSASIRLVREAVMTANASIVLAGASFY